MNDRESLELIIYKLTELEHKFTEVDERLEKIENYLHRQKGFIAGILFVGSCVAWVVSYVTGWWK